MHGYDFTERVRAVFALAREEALAREHEYVGTEHLLLAIVHEGRGVAATVLRNLKVDGPALVARIDEVVGRGKERRPHRDLPYSSRAKRSLELAMAEARERSHSYVGTEHLLLGLIREEQGIAAQLLVHVGATLDAVRAEVLRVLGAGEDTIREALSLGRVSGVSIAVHLADGQVVRREFRSVPLALAFLGQQQR